MGRKRYIRFRIIFLLAILVNSGVTVSDGVLNTNRIELTANNNAMEPGLCSDKTLVFDDQTDQFYNFVIADLPESHPSVQDNCSINHKFSISVWHPPKIS